MCILLYLSTQCLFTFPTLYSGQVKCISLIFYLAPIQCMVKHYYGFCHFYEPPDCNPNIITSCIAIYSNAHELLQRKKHCVVKLKLCVQVNIFQRLNLTFISRLRIVPETSSRPSFKSSFSNGLINQKRYFSQTILMVYEIRTILVHIQPTYIFWESIDANRKILKGSTKLVFLLMSLLEMKVKLNQGKLSINNQSSGLY